jgi:hypothetical protein
VLLSEHHIPRGIQADQLIAPTTIACLKTLFRASNPPSSSQFTAGIWGFPECIRVIPKKVTSFAFFENGEKPKSLAATVVRAVHGVPFVSYNRPLAIWGQKTS